MMAYARHVKFGDEIRTMVAAGAVTSTSARLWARCGQPGPYRLTIESAGAPPVQVEVEVDERADTTAAWTYPDDFPSAAPLAPLTAHTFRITHRNGMRVGEGRFTTAPDPAHPPKSFTFGAMSCHQPYNKDGSVSDRAVQMLRAVHEAASAREARFILAMGDQAYADAPPDFSLFSKAQFSRVGPPGRRSLLDCSRAEVRAIYQQRHRQAWVIPELQRIYADFPSWPMLDDHEIIDNFGSIEVHATSAWEAVRQGALDAFHDYQGSRVISAPPGERPTTFDHGFRWGGAAIFQLDNRSERRADATRTRVFTPAQVVALRRFLAEHRDARVQVIMTPVPLVFIPSWAANIVGEITAHHEGLDRWSNKRCLADRDLLFRILIDHARANPAQKILLLSGDIHVGTAFEIRWDDGVVFHQLTTSPVTNKESRFKTFLFELAPRSVSKLAVDGAEAKVSLIPAAGAAQAANPFGRLNIGFVHVEDDGARARIRLELVSVTDDEHAAATTVYSSPWLG